MKLEIEQVRMCVCIIQFVTAIQMRCGEKGLWELKKCESRFMAA